MSGRIIFKDILWKNFLSYGNNDNIINLDSNQLTAISGKNGCGKTSILSAIFYALFNKPLTKINKASLINNKNNKGLFVRLKFQIQNDVYIIERGMKPDILNFFKNGEVVSIEGDSRDFQNNLEENILKINSKAFTRLICLGYDYVRFFELSGPERREFIESILDLGILTDMTKKIKEYNKADSDDLFQIANLKSVKTSNLKIYNEQLNNYNSNIENETLILNEKIKSLEIKNDSNKNEILNIESKLKDLYSEQSEMNRMISEKNSIIQKYQILVSTGNTKIEMYTKEKSFFEHNLICPTCSRDIDKEFANEKINKLTNNVIKLHNKVEEAKNVVKQNNDLILNYNKILNDINSNIRSLDISKSQLEQDSNSNYYIISESKTNIEKISKSNSQQLDSIKNNISMLENEITDLNIKETKLTNNIDMYKKAISILSETGVKKSIIENYIEVINVLVNKYLDKFNFPFSFAMDNEFNETLLQDFREPVTYYNLSAGQRQRLDLSMLLTWRGIAKLRNSISSNLLIADEILDTNLDINGTKDLINILKSEDDYNIFIITHKDVIDDIDNIIRVEKEKFGFSILV